MKYVHLKTQKNDFSWIFGKGGFFNETLPYSLNRRLNTTYENLKYRDIITLLSCHFIVKT